MKVNKKLELISNKPITLFLGYLARLDLVSFFIKPMHGYDNYVLIVDNSPRYAGIYIYI